ncbi:hypothetical protein [Micromonospora carbonacea]|uniref:hypothetical protein n=1 Tax=Micromonospora carbonacea TaxID=47853 RepID=UPI0033C87D58
MSDQGKTYGSFIEAELAAERDRRNRFDDRGVSLVKTSGSLVTLLAAVVAFLRTGREYQFPRDAVGPLMLALTFLTIAAMAGIVTSLNRAYEVPNPPTLRKLLEERWAVDSEVSARNFVGEMQVHIIHSLRKGSNWKAKFLLTGLIAQVVALLALTVVVYIILLAYA